MTIRPIRETDVDACASLMTVLPLWRRYGVTLEGARAVFRRVLRGRARGLVAEERGRVAGFVVYRTTGTFDRSGYVRAVGVTAGAQRRGTGGRLMDAAEEEIFGRGPNVFLLVSAANTGARRFYERRGYRRIGEIRAYVRSGETEVLYRKTLGPIASECVGGRAGGARNIRSTRPAAGHAARAAADRPKGGTDVSETIPAGDPGAAARRSAGGADVRGAGQDHPDARRGSRGRGARPQ